MKTFEIVFVGMNIYPSFKRSLIEKKNIFEINTCTCILMYKMLIPSEKNIHLQSYLHLTPVSISMIRGNILSYQLNYLQTIT